MESKVNLDDIYVIKAKANVTISNVYFVLSINIGMFVLCTIIKHNKAKLTFLYNSQTIYKLLTLDL